MKAATRQAGFTLVEVLVVMILVGMIVTVLFQGLSQAIRIRRSAGIETAQLGREAMRRAWYRQLVNGLVPDEEDGAARFQGGPSSFKGQSTNPIDIDTGAVLPVAVALEIDPSSDTTVLRVTTDAVAGGREPIALLTLPGTNFSFAYVDQDASQSAVWPRRAIDRPPQLPVAIRIVDDSNNQATELLTAAILGRRDPAPSAAARMRVLQQ
jgi:general secretion pathway protein J